MTTINTINPANGKSLNVYSVLSDKALETLIDHTHQAFDAWRNTPVQDRTRGLASVATVLEHKKQDLARLITLEMGKPIKESVAEVEKCVHVCHYYAEKAADFLADETIDDNQTVALQPLGVILAVMPWNFPLWQVFRFAAPTLAAGNTCLLKHASNVSGCAIAIADIFIQAGLPKDIFNTLLLDSGRVKKVIEHPNVQAVTLTGSTQVGKTIAMQAGGVLKKCVLELGGNDPYIVLRDADVDAAAKICATSRMINGGQSCISAKRFIVDKSILSQFENALAENMLRYKMGDPLLDTTLLGPMAKATFAHQLQNKVAESIKQGARLVATAEVLEDAEAYFPATVLSDVPADSPAYCDEIFGPVASIIPAKNDGHAIAIANDSLYGLGAAVFTEDAERGEMIARKLEAGCCAINDYVRSTPELPFGGIKQSGYGRELSHYGIKEFVNIKTIVRS